MNQLRNRPNQEEVTEEPQPRHNGDSNNIVVKHSLLGFRHDCMDRYISNHIKAKKVQTR